MPRAYKPTDPVEESISKPLPDLRPGTAGTSGTEAILTTNRRQASHNFQRAQRAERAYRARKRASAAREGYHEAGGHFKESARQFGFGMKKMARVVKSIPYVLGEKNEARRKGAEAKKKEKAMKKKAELEERLARQAADEEEENAGKEKEKEGDKQT
ncbi:hypothetical protein NLU13_0495 [Sarocladium strictum]|uniref:Uncharacterized protein n=1 Tax=Sarocladium strictum TaxID=5046 RepID=A0AA39LBB9_SARSR|nr:hypothetical protein NLU13_0495 [Sarocladium strictum]